MRLTLLIPGLFPLPLAAGLFDRYQDLPVPALEWLFARGVRESGPGMSLEAYLLRRYGIDDTFPVAGLTYLGDGGAPDTAYWLRADPVHLQAQRDQLALVDAGVLAISAAEASALIESLNLHFKQDNLLFISTTPTRWYVALDTAPNMVTHPLSAVAGKSINACLPSGKDSLRWNQIATEIQMLLHTHPVNEARDAQDLPTINSVWFWGGGLLPDLRSSKLLAEQLWANDALARGLALATQHTPQALPPNFDAFMAQANSADTQCVIWDSLRRAECYGDYDAWRAGLLCLESDWIAPIKVALRRGIISEVRLQAINEQCCLSVTTKSSGRWHFWRTRKALKHYFPAA